MNYWWVNQKQTFRHEVGDGYMWAPKLMKNGARSEYYENMTKVRTGDVVFSYFKRSVSAIGVITSEGYSQQKPNFGAAGDAWNTDGWMVNVDYTKLDKTVSPRDHIERLKPLLPQKYSPIRENGLGNQVYLCAISAEMGAALFSIIGTEAAPIVEEANEIQGSDISDTEAEDHFYRKLIEKRTDIDSTEKSVLIQSRRGQGRFRNDVLSLHKCCPVSNVSNSAFLRAGHIKRWALSNDEERMDPLNGFPFSPNVDLLFEKGFFSFDSERRMIVSPLLEANLSSGLGFDRNRNLKIVLHDPRQAGYLEFHRIHTFKAGT